MNITDEKMKNPKRPMGHRRQGHQGNAVVTTGRLSGRPGLCGAHLGQMRCRVGRRWYKSESGGSLKKLDLDDRFLLT